MSGLDQAADQYGPKLHRRRFIQYAGATGALMAFGDRFLPAGAAGALQEPATELRGRAIVIGLNEYRDARPLQNPVRDACRFAEWLVRKAGVQPEDIELLTSPETLPPDVPRIPEIGVKSATRENMLRTITEFPRRADDRGERLYFYYSGHGTSFQPREMRGTIDEQDAIVPCDFTEFGNKPIPINWILDVLMASRYVEQFFFFDACRNLQNVKPEPHNEPPPLLPGRTPPLQYLLFATAPRRVALDLATGSFTERLLAALYEARGVKPMFDQAKGKYLVRWNALFDCLSDQFRKKCERIGFEDDREICQQPEKDIRPSDHGEYPYLVALDRSEVGKIGLTIDVMPPDLRSKARLTITSGLGTLVVDRARIPTDKEFEISLEPGFYQAMVEVGPDTRRLSPLIELVEDQRVSLSIAPIALSSVAPIAPVDESAQPRAAPVARSGARLPAPPQAAPAERQGSASLTLTASDRLTQIELVDASGAPVRWRDGRPCTALGTLEVGGLKPGIYRARFYAADGRLTERIVPLAAGVRKEVSLETPMAAAAPPIPLELSKAIREGGPDERPRGLEALIVPNEQAVPAPGPSAYLVQALRAMDGDPNRAALLAKNLGLAPFPGREGIRIVLGVDLGASTRPRDALESIKVSLGGLDDELKPLEREHCQVEGVAVFTVPKPSGAYRLRVEREFERAEFALTVLKGRLSEVILEQQEGRILISQFAPEAHPEAPPNAEHLFKLDRLERALQGGQSRVAPALLGELAASGVADPIVSALRAYLAAIGGGPEPLTVAGRRLAERFPDLPDGHVAVAWSAEGMERPDAARASYLAALEHGLPILAIFARFLADGLARLKIDHPRAPRLREATRRQIPGLLWTAWRPSEA